jgi:hypothetical protein
MIRAFFILLFLLHTQSAVSQSTLLRLKVIEQEYTGYYPKCDNCVPVSFWYVNKAEVKDVIVGDFKDKFISFGNLQHAKYVNEYVGDVYVILNEFKDSKLKDKLGVLYYASGFIFAKNLVCFSNDIIDSVKDEVKDALYIKDSKQSCYIEALLED